MGLQALIIGARWASQTEVTSHDLILVLKQVFRALGEVPDPSVALEAPHPVESAALHSAEWGVHLVDSQGDKYSLS